MGPASGMENDASDYAIISICGEPGTLHMYKARDNAPRLAQTQCHVHSAAGATLAGGMLYALTRSANATMASIAAHDLTRGGGSVGGGVGGTAVRRSTAPEPVTIVAASASGGLLAVGGSSGRVHIWHIGTGVLQSSFSAHGHSITALAFSDDDSTLLTAAGDASVHLFRVSDVVSVVRHDDVPPLRQLVGHNLPVCAAAMGFAGVSSRVVTASADRSVRIWHAASGTCISTSLLPVLPKALAFARDETLVCLALADGSVALISVNDVNFGSVAALDVAKTGIPPIPTATMSAGPPPTATAVALSPNGEELVVGYADGVTRIYDVQSRTLLHTYAKHSTTAAVTYVATLPAVPEPRPGDTVAHPPPALARIPVVSEMNIEDSRAAAAVPPILIDLASQPPIGDVASSLIDRAFASAFPRCGNSTEIVPEGEVTHQKGDKSQIPDETVENAVLDDLIREVNFLRKRNLKLEQAGRRLAHLVENDM